MITTAIQQAPQMLEIQGAPSAIEGLGDEFRATFAANVNSSPKQPGTTLAEGAKSEDLAVAGSSSAKQVLLAGPSLKSLSAAVSGGAKNVFVSKAKAIAAETVAPEPAMDAVSAGNFADGSDLSSISVTQIKTGEDASKTSVDLPAKSSTPVSDPDNSKGLSSNLKSLPVSVAAGQVIAASAQTKRGGPSSSEEGSLVRSRKGDVSASSRPTASETTEVVAPNAPLLLGGVVEVALTTGLAGQVDPSTTAQMRQGQIGQGATKGAEKDMQSARTVERSPVSVEREQLFPSAIESSSGTASLSVAVSTRNQARTLSAPAEEASFSAQTSSIDVVSSARNTSATPKADADADASRSIQGAMVVQAATGQSTAAFIKAGPPDYQSRAGAFQTQAEAAASLAVPGVLGARPALPGATGTVDTFYKRQPEAAQAKSVGAATTNGVKTSVALEVPGIGSASQARALVKPQTVTPATSLLPALSAASKVNGTASKSDAENSDKQSEVTSKPDGVVNEQASDTVLALRERGALQPLDAGASPAPLSVSIPGVTSVAGTDSATAGKEDKPKAVGAAPAGEISVPSTGAPIIAGGQANWTSNNSTNVTGGNATGVAGTAVAVPVAQAATSAPGLSVHAPSAGSGSSAAARTWNEANRGSTLESGATASQIGESHRTLVATPTTLEVGVQSGTQGWLRIRAEVGGQGEVNASLAAGSSGAREALHNQMPALNAFLHSEQMAVTTTVVDRGTSIDGQSQGTATGAGALDSQDRSGGSSASLLQGGGAHSDGSQRDDPDKALSVGGTGTMSSYDARGGVSDISGLLQGRTSLSEESGRWLNIRV